MPQDSPGRVTTLWRDAVAVGCVPATYGALLLASVPVSNLFIAGTDEGMELAKAATLARDPAAASALWNDQPVFYSWFLSKLFLAWGISVGPARWATVGFAIILLGSVSFLASRAARSGWAGILSALSLAFSPIFLTLSFSAMQEVPATAMACLGLAIALSTTSPPSTARLVSAGICFGLAILLKLTMLMSLAVAALAFLAGSNPTSAAGNPAFSFRDWIRVRAARIATLVVAALGTFFTVTFLLEDWRPDQLFGSHWQAKDAMKQMGFFSEHGARHSAKLSVSLLALGLLGFAAAWWQHARHALYLSRLLIWLAIISLFTALIRPWWSCYGLHLHAALAVCAGFLAADWRENLARMIRLPEGNRPLGDWLPVAGLLVVAILGAKAFSIGFGDWQRWTDARQTAHVAQVNLMRQYARPHDYVYSDDPIIPFHAGLKIPPQLAVISQKRVITGQASDAYIGSVIASNDCRQIFISPEHRSLRAHIPRLTNDFVLVSTRVEGELWVHRELNPTPEALQKPDW